ncbi:MAG: hypothetical protein Q9186_005682 [Xanthomendoza sp. 1 TL-2023]
MSSSDEQEDEELQMAIALSLQTSQPRTAPTAPTSEQQVISLDSDASTTDDEASAVPCPLTSLQAQTLEPAPVARASGILGLDRKLMEQERLARKRKVSISPPPLRKSFKTSKPRSKTVRRPSPGPAAQVSCPAQTGNLLYANGAIRKTWAFGYPRENDIKLEEVLQKKDLTLAVLSSFQWDVEWLLGKISMDTTQLVFVMQADTDVMKVQYRRETAAMSNLRLCFPSMEGQINCMHSKLMLLSYPQHLRVVVPTANLVPYDWGETGIMENTVFLIDLPRLSADRRVAIADDMTDFAKDLIYFLQAMGLEQTIIDSIRSFDFSATQDLAFVHTVGGAHAGAHEPWRRTGYCGLGRAISQLRLASDKSLNIDYITSSVGSLNLDFLTALYLAAQGDDGLTEYTWRTQVSRKKAKAAEKDDLLAVQKEYAQKKTSDGLRIYYPSLETVKASRGGTENGGTICFQSKWWNAPTFPRELLRDCTSRREGLLMHNKRMGQALQGSKYEAAKA